MIYQKYLVTEYRLGLIEEKDNIDDERASGLRHVADVIMKNLAYSCLFMPLLMLACIFSRFDVLISVYSVYCFIVLIASGVFFVKKAFTLNSRVEAKKK